MITFNGVPSTARATARYIESVNQPDNIAGLIAPREIYVLGQYNSGKSPTANVRQRILTEEDAWSRYGQGSLLARMIKFALNQSNGVIPVYAVPLADNGSAVDATGELAVTASSALAGTIYLYIGGQRILVSVTAGQTATQIGDAIEAAITAAPNLPVAASNDAGTVTLTAKWGGEAGNDIPISLNYNDDESLPSGVSIAVTQMASGANNPVLTTALANIPETATDILCPYYDSTSLGALADFGDDRYAADVKAPVAVFFPYSATQANYITFLDDYNSQWLTSCNDYVSLESPLFEFVAAICGEFARQNQTNPARPTFGAELDGIVPTRTPTKIKTTDANTIVNAGGSWIKFTDDGRVLIADLVTTRTETDLGAPDEDWRFTSTIANLQTKIYSMDVVFSSPPFVQAMVVDDEAVVDVDYAVRPSLVKQYIVRLMDDLWIPYGLSKDRQEIIDSLTAEIDGSNASRINLSFVDKMAAGLRIIAVKHNWRY